MVIQEGFRLWVKSADYLTITSESQIGALLRLMEELSQKIYANQN